MNKENLSVFQTEENDKKKLVPEFDSKQNGLRVHNTKAQSGIIQNKHHHHTKLLCYYASSNLTENTSTEVNHYAIISSSMSFSNAFIRKIVINVLISQVVLENL